MTKSTRRRTLCASCDNHYNAKGDHGSCPFCSGQKPMPPKKPNKHGFVNHGGGSKRGAIGDKMLAEFEKRKVKP